MSYPLCACGCGEPVTSKAARFRRGHWAKLYAKGNPAASRFWAKVDKGAWCWEWTGAKTSRGYGNFSVWDGRNVPAHRYAYEAMRGPIPVGLDLDHLCRNRGCVNPAHLEPVSRRENTLRGASPTVIAYWRRECIHGHELTPENTAPNGPGKTRCRTCQRASEQRRKWRAS
jgi:hypothetical protein